MTRDEIPVTVLSGSLGAGKTTLLNHVLTSAGDLDIAVLVNDMGEVNVDAELLDEQSELSMADGGVTELSNGCICCELRGDLETEVVRLAREREFDHLVVEASGISEPQPVARLFTTGSPAAARYRVDAVVAVVDSRQFYDAFGESGKAERHGTGEDGTRPLSDLLVEQVEFANVVLCNKADLVTDDEMAVVEDIVRSLRPDAKVIRTTHSAADLDEIIGIDRYDPGRAADAAGWKQLLDTDEDVSEPGDDHHPHDADEHGHSHDGHSHPQEVYGVGSFTFRRRRPMHPQRIADLLSSLPDAVVRSKGTMWVAGREELKQTYSQAGPSARVEATGQWVASRPEFEQDAYRRNHPDMDWDDEWGDRRTELVFIGRAMDEPALRTALADAVLTDEEMNADWSAYENPFPDALGEEVVLAEPDPEKT